MSNCSSNNGRIVRYIFALSQNIDVENLVIHRSAGGPDIPILPGMIIASYDKDATRWLYSAYDEDGTLRVHDVTDTSDIEHEIEEILADLQSKLNIIEGGVEGHITVIGEDGQLEDSGRTLAEIDADVQDKIPKVVSATQGHVPQLENDGSLSDSGKSIQDIESEVVGSASDTASDNTVYGAKAFASDAVQTLDSTAVSPLASRVSDLESTRLTKQDIRGSGGIVVSNPDPGGNDIHITIDSKLESFFREWGLL